MDETHVVTAFLMEQGKVLLLRRSNRVGTYRGAWAGISGFVERKPVEQAYLELEEEVGLSKRDCVLQKSGKPLRVRDEALQRLWVIHPFLFQKISPRPVRLDWEHKEYRWICPWTIDTFSGVPGLTEALHAVLPLFPPEIQEGKSLLQKDTASGAMEMATKAVEIFSEVARHHFKPSSDYFEKLRFWAHQLAMARPSMAPVGNALGSIILTLRTHQKAQPENFGSPSPLLHLISTIRQELDASRKKAAKQLVQILKPFSCVITLSRSSTLLAAFRSIRKRHRQAIVAESRPLFEGRDTAKALAELGFSVTLIADAALAYHITQADVAVVGADALLADGSVVNKIGSHLLALAAREKGIPFYVGCEEYKRYPATEVSAFPFETANPREIFAHKIPNLVVHNQYFEAIPAHLITRIITDQGEFSPADIGRLAQKSPPPVVALQHPFQEEESFPESPGQNQHPS